jgi:methyl-accepting chemotaxis protein
VRRQEGDLSDETLSAKLDRSAGLVTGLTDGPGSPARAPTRRGTSLRIRIMILVELVLVATIAVTITAATYQADQALREQLQRQSEATTNLLVGGLTSALRVPPQIEAALDEQFVAQARILAYMVAAAERAGMTPEEIDANLRDIVAHSAIDELFITDETAHAYLTNTDIDFSFSPSPIEQPQASQFFPLLNQQYGSVAQAAQPRDFDGQVFKYTGVSGVDRPRIVQVGHQATVLEELAQTYSVQTMAEDAVDGENVLYVRLVDPAGNTLALAWDEKVDDVASGAGPEADLAAARQAMANRETVIRDETEALVLTAPLLDEGDTASGAAIVYFSTENLQQVRRLAVSGGLLLGGLMAVLGGAGAYWLSGRIVQPLQGMVQLSREVAQGKLSTQIEVRRQGELGQLEAALAQMTGNLQATIWQIRDSAAKIGDSAENIETVVSELNEAANQQSAAVSETSTAMEELRTVAEQIAAGSESANRAAGQTQRDVQSGLEAVSETVSRMEEIRTSNEASVGEILALGQKARQIGAVMDLIDDIAAQTKLIAVNASIEAAAAGEAGRRFAVVASQVRHLAENVGQSTGEIRKRIVEIQTATNELVVAAEQGTKKINQGVSLSQTTQSALEQIATSADETTMAARQITLSTRQQQTAVEQVIEALGNLSAEVNRVAASSDQTSRVVADLAHLSDTLSQMVALFELESE